MRINSFVRNFIMILLLTLLTAFDTASAGWELIRNSPTTHDLRSVIFLDDNTGWIAGDNSTIFKTTDSGQNWLQQTSPEASNFQCITFLGADTGWACGTGGTVIKTTDGGANWFSQTFTAAKFNSLHFIDENIGFIAGDNGIIWKTINGGNNWVNQPSGIDHNLNQIRFINPDSGFAVGDNAYILETINGGNSWEINNGPEIPTRILHSIELNENSFLTAGTIIRASLNRGAYWFLMGFLAEVLNSITYLGYGDAYVGVGLNGYIVKTTDYGRSWTQEQSPTIQNLYSVHFPHDSNFIWTVGAGGTILKYIPNWEILPSHFCSDVDFIDRNNGWVVGSNGYIAKTINGGESWITQTSGTPRNLRSIYFTNPTTGYTVGEVGTILTTTTGGDNWDTLSSGVSANLYSVYFPDANTGYAVGAFGTILKTINGGTNWITQTSEINDYIYSVYFIDTNIGYIVGSSGKICKTINGGALWTLQPSESTSSLTSVYFTDADTGYAVGTEGTIIKTINGGADWISQTSGTDIVLNSVYFLDANVGYMCSFYNIYKTYNGGNTWVADDLPPLNLNEMRSIDFVVENHTAVGFAVGDKNLRTSFEYFSGGFNGNSGSYPGWVPVNSGTDRYLGGAEYVNPFVAYAVGGTDPPGSGNGTILRTINGGQTWTSQQSNVNADFEAVSFVDVNNGIAVGYPTYIVHTANAGIEWNQQTSPTNHTLIDIDMLDANHAYICGDDAILYTSDAGENWQMQTPPSYSVWNDIDFINQTTATACGATIIRTTNAGANWFTQNSGVLEFVISIDFIDENNGIAITQFGPALYTTDGGANWILSDTLGYVQKVHYVTATNAYAIGYGGLVYRSTDSGVSWEIQDVNTEENFLSLSFSDADNGVIVGQNGTILRTSNGGDFSQDNNSYARNGLEIPISDFQNTYDSLYVNITDRLDVFEITRVYVNIDTVLHSNDGDLEIYLEHGGITDTLIYHNGGDGDNFLGTFLNDDANFPLLSGTAPFRGSFEPYSALSKFNGQNPNGYWNLKIYDSAAGGTGTLDAWSLTLLYQPATGIDEGIELPLRHQLSQNYPNPFNPSTTISYELTEPSFVSIRIFNILGQEVSSLVNEIRAAGSYEISFDAGSLSSGIYFYRFEAGTVVQSKKMLLLK